MIFIAVHEEFPRALLLLLPAYFFRVSTSIPGTLSISLVQTCSGQGSATHVDPTLEETDFAYCRIAFDGRRRHSLKNCGIVRAP